MLHRLIHALVQSNNEAADDLLLQALRLGNAPEQQVALDALLKRETSRGLSGAVPVAVVKRSLCRLDPRRSQNRRPGCKEDADQ